MLQRQSISDKTELIRLHSATCLSMTQFINGHHCPKLSHLIVQQLSLLVAHPDLERVSNSRDIYQQLLEHWQKVTAYLLEQRAARGHPSKFH
ncbi:MAG: hypothetical protein WAW36_17935 [Methylovulum miyakonense]|uniref:hypothetical protein n=1 Tax=Methylovulum miyakonense TaxID=645578 RepID=UPI003BB77977